MDDLLEWKALFSLTKEGCPCSMAPCAISCTCIEHRKQDKTWEQQGKSIIYTSDKGN